MKEPSPTPARGGTEPAGAQDSEAVARQVREMFGRIAHRYDFLNHLLSFSIDKLWRRRTARALRPILGGPGSRAIDLCCGTGDLMLELARVSAGLVVGSDFCHPMLEIGARKARRGGRARHTALVEADSLRLPFADASFDLVTVAFGFRNLADYGAGLAEMRRVVKPGGVVAILEFSQPSNPLFRRIYHFYFTRILPRVGTEVSGVAGPYDYLPASVQKFPDQRELLELMREAGFVPVTYQNWTGGIVALHTGVKPQVG